MPVNGAEIYQSREQIVSDLLAAWQARIPNINTGVDSIVRIDVEVLAELLEGLFLTAQLLHNDIFIQTASALSLQRFGEEYGRPQKGGTLATGSVRFSGSAGSFIPAGTQAGAPRPSLSDELVFETTTDATIPSPGVSTAPVASDGGGSGALAAGTYEWAVSFTTAEGETAIGPASNAQILAASHKGGLASIPLGGPGTTGRNVYRRVNGGAWGLSTHMADNTTTVLTDNVAATTTPPVTASTAERVSVACQATDVGVEYNADIGTVIDIVGDPGTGVPSGLSGVVNVSAFTGGSDEEDIEDFRRALLQWVRDPESGSIPDLIAWATSVEGCNAAAVTKNQALDGSTALGTVAVRISGPNGAVPDAGVIAAVQAELDAKDLANVTIVVGTFAPVNTDVAVTVTPAVGYVVADVTASAQAAIAEYINLLPVGATVYKSGIIAAVMSLSTIINVTTTFTDTTHTALEKAVSHTITVS